MITITEFLTRPTLAQWRWAIEAGWPGPDGSSMSTDRICGVRIGITSPDHVFVDLPANRHDWYYLLGRLLRLSEAFRAAADRAYRDMCLERVRANLRGRRRAVAVARCHARYVALRVGARFAWTQRSRLRAIAWDPGAA